MQEPTLSLSTLPDELPASKRAGQEQCLDLPIATSFSWSHIRQATLSTADQVFSVGGMFLANVALARAQSKEEYGMFALSYSVFTFVAGLHNAAILEAYTIYGSGRYHRHFPEYSRLIWRTNAGLGAALTVALVTLWGLLLRIAPALATRALLAMALTIGVLLTAAFVRRDFYIRRRPDLAAGFSLVYITVLVALLWLTLRAGRLNSFSVFVIAASAWAVACLCFAREWPGQKTAGNFAEVEPAWRVEHWKYSRWVVATAFVFQFTTQGYYWLVAGFLSVKEVAELRAIYNLVAPVDQVFIAMTLLILPMMAFQYAAKRTRALVSLWEKYCAFSLVVTGAFAALVWVAGKPVLHFVYGGKFDNVAAYLSILALLPVVMGLGNSVNAILKAAEKPNWVLLAYTASGAATFCLGIPLVTHLGLRGAVYGMLVSAGAYTATLGVGLFSFVRTEREAISLANTMKEHPL